MRRIDKKYNLQEANRRAEKAFLAGKNTHTSDKAMSESLKSVSEIISNMPSRHQVELDMPDYQGGPVKIFYSYERDGSLNCDVYDAEGNEIPGADQDEVIKNYTAQMGMDFQDYMTTYDGNWDYTASSQPQDRYATHGTPDGASHASHRLGEELNEMKRVAKMLGLKEFMKS